MRLKEQAEHERMMSLYRQHVLGEKPVAGSFVPLASIAPASPAGPGDEAEESASTTRRCA